MARRKKDGLDRAKDLALRTLKRSKLGAFAYYPVKETPKGKEIAFFVAQGPLAKRFARWITRAS